MGSSTFFRLVGQTLGAALMGSLLIGGIKAELPPQRAPELRSISAEPSGVSPEHRLTAGLNRGITKAERDICLAAALLTVLSLASVWKLPNGKPEEAAEVPARSSQEIQSV
jgi:hypothetical protein